MSQSVSNIEALEDRFREEQDALIPVLPPSEEFVLRQPIGGSVVPFDPSDFPKQFAEGLIGMYRNSVSVYPLTIAEDPKTRATLFLNSSDEIIYSLPAPKDYDPYAFLFYLYPLLDTGLSPKWWVLTQYALWDPARIQVSTTLIAEKDVEPYLYAEAAVAQYASLFPSGGGFMMMSGGGGGSNDLWLSLDGPVQGVTNAVEIVAHIPSGFTNRLEFYSCTNLYYPWWTVEATNMHTAGTNAVVWTNDNISTVWRHYYVAGNADIDGDSDGLPDAREIFVHHTDGEDSDSDDDGYPDLTEVNLGTNPNQSNPPPAIAISSPVNGGILP